MKNLLFILISFVFLSACSGGSSTDEVVVPDNSFIRFKVNGVEKEYKTIPILQERQFSAFFPSKKNVLIQRFDASTPDKSFQFNFKQTNLLTISYPKSYTAKQDDKVPSVTCGYTENDSFYGMNILNPSSFSVSLDSYESNVVKGSFAGSLYVSKTDTVSITDGTFKIKLRTY